MQVSIVIKALNEEANIARTIASCLAALEGIGGEVILADCLSQDRTVEIASRHPVRIVQLLDPADRGCGTAPQLGYQYARGEFIYLIDGDMELQRDFLPAALAAARASPRLAGVGGVVREMRVENLEFISRTSRNRVDLKPGAEVDRLDGGGLYRRSALESVGYLSDRNLHAFEEFELATRLRGKGWRLTRLDRVAVDHYGYTTNAYRLLWQRARSGYVRGAGELARATIGRASFAEVVRKIRTLPISLFVIAWLGAVLLLPFLAGGLAAGLGLALLLTALPPAVMSVRRRSVRLGCYAVAVWIVYMIGTLRGFLQRRVDPAAWIPSRVVQGLPAATPARAAERPGLMPTSPAVTPAEGSLR